MNGKSELSGVRHLGALQEQELNRGRLCFELGCNGCDECTDFDEDDSTCPRCEGDGMDKLNDYLLPCPECGGRSNP